MPIPNANSLNRAARLIIASRNPMFRDTTRAAAMRAAERIILRKVSEGNSSVAVWRIVDRLVKAYDK